MSSEPTPTLNDRYIYAGRVTRVVNGDTIICDIDLGFGVWLCNKRCQLFGIDAVEDRGKDVQDGKWAKVYLDFLIHTTKPLIIRTHLDDADKHGRLLVEIWQDGVSVNQRMVDDGYAVLTALPKCPACDL